MIFEIVPSYIKNVVEFNGLSNDARIVYIHQHYLYKRAEEPEVSIIIPTYNKEKSILQALQSLCLNRTNRKFEIIVINNNSTDKTAMLVRATGIKCINESIPNITAARNAGLGESKGKYILCADAGVIYPRDWIDTMVKPLESNNKFCLTYGRFCFLPESGKTKIKYYFYEIFANFFLQVNKKFKDEAINVVGFNVAFRKEQGIKVDYFNHHPKEKNRMSHMAIKLINKGFGKLHYVSSSRAKVWATEGCIQAYRWLMNRQTHN